MILEKIQKRISLDSIDVYDFDGITLQEAIDMLEELKNEQYNSTMIEVETDYYNNEDGYANLNIYGYRIENDEELEVRQNAHNKTELQKYLNEQEKIRKEKELLIELKQKYENGS